MSILRLFPRVDPGPIAAQRPPIMRALRTPPPLDERTIERALAQLRELVRSRGLKSSSVRDAVARVALTLPGHFTVDELVGALREAGVEDAHQATVYRTLPLLVDAGLLQPALLGSSDRGRYERAFDRDHHDHLVCERCGRIVEFEFEAIEVLQRDLATQLGFTLTRHVHELVGVCADCSAAAPSERAQNADGAAISGAERPAAPRAKRR